MDKLRNIRPGKILLEEFLLPMQIGQTRLANSIGVPPRRINEIVLGKRGITADTALRLAKAFGNSVQFWMRLQDAYELREARSAFKDQLERVMPIAAQFCRAVKWCGVVFKVFACFVVFDPAGRVWDYSPHRYQRMHQPCSCHCRGSSLLLRRPAPWA
jgi:antitoxin HigA-1